jgi:serine protease Do
MNELHVRRWAAALFVTVAILVGSLIGSLATVKAQHTHPVLATLHSSTGYSGEVSFQNGFAPVVEKALPAVVNISSTKTTKTQGGNLANPFFSDPFFRQFFGRGSQMPREQREHSLGSGVIVSPDGYILTNNHVIDGANDIEVALSDRRDFRAKVVGADAKTDLAVIKIGASGLPTLPMGDSSAVRVGQFVLAIGDPFGVGETVTMGIVSAKGRGGLGIEDYEDFIQTDAAINPGNSGGALINPAGQLIGINTAILTGGGGGGNQGVGFAIPVSMAQNVMDQIRKNGKVTRGWLGVGIQPLTPDLATAFGLKENKGALIAQVEPGSPAAKAGLQQGDVIQQVNGQAVDDARALTLKISQMAPGSTVKLTVLRNGKQQEISATLGEMPGQKAVAENGAKQPDSGEATGLSGVEVDNLTPDIAQQLKLPASTQGVVVTDVSDGTPASDAGLQRGDVIQEVNHQPVRNVGDLNRALRQAGGKQVLLLVNRGGNTSYVVIQR